MRELPRQLSADELAELFSGRTRLVERLAERAHPLDVADEVAAELPEADQAEALAAHPRIGEPSAEQRGAEPEVLAERARPLDVADEVAAELPEADQAEALAAHPRIGEPSAEQRGAEPEVLAELADLNRAYEERFGFRFVVFVAGRTRAELLRVLRARIERSRDEELETGLRELVAIARDRWQRA